MGDGLMSASTFKTTVQIDGAQLRKLETKSTGARLYAREVRESIDETSAWVEGRAEVRAPEGKTHRLADSVARTLDPSPVPLYAKITAGAENDGFRYGMALQAAKFVRYRAGPRVGDVAQYHYRNGRLAGRRTRGWFSGAMRGAKKRLEQALQMRLGRIEGKWRS